MIEKKEISSEAVPKTVIVRAKRIDANIVTCAVAYMFLDM